MKTFITISAALVTACLLNSTAATAPGVEEFDRSTAELAASLILEKLQTDILAAEPDSGSLFTAMESNPGPYVDPDEARGKLEKDFSDGIANRYREEAVKYLDRLAGDAGRVEVFGKDFLNDAVELPSDKLAETVKRTYPDAFGAARTRVCKEQSERLVARIQPTEKEFEETPLANLTELMTARIAQAQAKPVFKENMAFISGNIVKPMLEAAEAQRAEQRVRLENLPMEGWAPGVIAKELEAGITAFVAESAPRHKEAGRVAYGVFPSIVAAVPKTAETRAAGKMARVVEDTEVKIDIAEILKEVEENPAAHKNVEDSMKTFAPTLERRLGEEALTRSESLIPEDERAAFRAFAEKAVGEGQIKTAIEKRVRNVLLPEVRTVRDECADRQMTKHFAGIKAETWFPSGGLVDTAYAQTDYRKAIKEWRSLAELEPFAKTAKEQPLMEETEKKLDDGIAALFDRGRMAQSRQHAIVDEVFGEMKELIAAEKKLPDLEGATGLYSEKVTKVWTEERGTVLWGDADAYRPPNADRQHVELFPSTNEKIMLKVKSLMESIEKERQEKEAPPVKPPEEIPPEEVIPEDAQDPAPPEEPELVELDCRFVFDLKKSDISLVFYSGDVEKASLECPQSPERYRREYEKTLERAVKALLEETGGYTSKGSKVALKVNIIVRDDLVYYGIVAKLSQMLKLKTAELSETGVSMELKDTSLEQP